MKTVIKLGGVNGSGKTTVARALLKAIDSKPYVYMLQSGKMTLGYRGEWNGLSVEVLGKYGPGCGGMDTISNKDDRFEMVKMIASLSSVDVVFFEGLITGKTYGALGELSEAHRTFGEAVWLYAFMDTPFDVAADRVRKRRMAAGNSAPFDPERTMRSTYESCTRLETYLRGTAKGRIEIGVDHPVHSIKHTDRPYSAARKLLEQAVKVRSLHAN